MYSKGNEWIQLKILVANYWYILMCINRTANHCAIVTIGNLLLSDVSPDDRSEVSLSKLRGRSPV